MRFLGVSALALALGAQATLLPPSISMADADFWEGASPIMSSHSKATVYLDCPSCPVAVGNVNGQPEQWISGPATELLLQLTSRNNHLYLNEVPIFPPSAGGMKGPVSAKQVSTRTPWTNTKSLFNGPIALSTSIEIHPHVEVNSINMDSSSAQLSRVPMRRLSVDVLGVNGRAVRVESIEVRFREDTLEIYDVTVSRGQDTPATTACQSVFCRFAELVKARMDKLRQLAASKMPAFRSGCSRKPKGLHHGRPQVKGGLGKFGGKFTPEGEFKGFRPGQHRPHRHHAHHRHSAVHRVLHRVVRFFNHIVLPVLIGIAAGMAVSGIGMVLGHAFFMLWRYARGERGGYTRLDQLQHIVLLEESEEDALEVVDALPRYEEVGPAPPKLADEKEAQ